MRERKMSDFAIEFSFPLTIYTHFGDLDYVANLKQ